MRQLLINRWLELEQLLDGADAFLSYGAVDVSNQHDCFQDLEHLGDTRLDNFHGLAFDSLLDLLNVLLSQLLQLFDIVHAGLEGGKISSHSIFQIYWC